MPFDLVLPRLDWGPLYVASEWIVRIAALIYVPQRRPPNAARAWLLLIFFLPWLGLVLYLLIGRAYMPRRRFKVQRQIYELVRRLVPRPPSFESTVVEMVPHELLPALRLADSLSEFPMVGGNRFELLPVYDAAIARIVAEIDGAQRFVHMLFYIFEDDDVGRHVAAALERAARRGVSVRVLMDAIGSRDGLRGLGPGLRKAGAEVVPVMPLRLWGPNAARFDLRNHRKIVVVDGVSAFFGSQNIVSAHANRGMVNEEMLVRATGPIVRHLHAVLLGRPLPGARQPAARIGRSHARNAVDGHPGTRAGGAERPRLQRRDRRSRDGGAHVRRALARRADLAVRHPDRVVPGRDVQRRAPRRGGGPHRRRGVEQAAGAARPAVVLRRDAARRRAHPSPSAELPAREALEHRRRRRAHRLVELRRALLRVERGSQRADLRPRRGRAAARHPGRLPRALRRRSRSRHARGLPLGQRVLENLARLTDSLL